MISNSYVREELIVDAAGVVVRLLKSIVFEGVPVKYDIALWFVHSK